MDYVGIVRSDRRLEIALQRILQIRKTVEDLYWKCRLTQDLLELRNIVLVGELNPLRQPAKGKQRASLHGVAPGTDDRYLPDTVIEKTDF